MFFSQIVRIPSVSVGFSACSGHFSLFGGAKVGASATNGRREEGEGRRVDEGVPFLPSTTPSPTFMCSPQFSRGQKAKNASNLRKALSLRLRAQILNARYYSKLTSCFEL